MFRSELPPRAMSMSTVLLQLGATFEVWTVTRNDLETHAPCSCWLRRPGRLLLLWYWWLQMHDWEGGTWKASVIISIFTKLPPLPKKKKCLYRKPPKRTLKKCYGDAKEKFFTTDGLRETRDFNLRAGHWEVDHALLIWMTQIGLFFLIPTFIFIIFVWRGKRSQGCSTDMEGLGSVYGQDAWWVILRESIKMRNF